MSTGKSRRDIGDPFERVATTGRIGGTKPPDVQKSKVPEVEASKLPEPQTSESSATQKSRNSKAQESKGSNRRIQRTIYLPPALAKWLKFQAVEEEREISEIVTEALERYQRSVQ